MAVSLNFKRLIIATTVVATVIVLFFVHALAGLNARSVVFAQPPAYVEQYTAEMDHSDPSSLSKEAETNEWHVDEPKYAKLTADLSAQEALVFKVIMDGDLDSESLGMLLRLFAHPDKSQRVKVARAFAAVQIKFTHDEESGFPEKRNQFWIDAKEHFPNIQNALSEALIASAKEGTANGIPYTLAWLPGQGHETIELFAWAAKHHPEPRVRRSSIYYVVKLGGHEDLAGPLLRNRAHDPDYRVRKLALDIRFKRLTGEL